MKNRRFNAPVLGSAMLAACLLPEAAHAQEVNLNYDTLSSLEEPIAFELGDVTVALTGLIDLPLAIDIYSATPTDDVEPGFIGNFQISAQTQLSNRWTIGAAYFGQYATDANNFFDGVEDYSDNVAGFVGTSFGTFIGGNVAGQVREQTRRRRGVGNGYLAFDDFYGGLDDWGGAYVGRFGPTVIAGAVDENGDFEIGGFFQRPLGRKDYRFAVRLADGRFTSNDGTTQFDTKGIGAVGEFVYGSSLYDVGIGYERLESGIVDVDRWYISAGAQTQIGPVTLSGEGHYGRIAGQSEKSAAIGASYALARGLSLNLGINYEEAQIDAAGVNLVSTDEVQGLVSLRFSF